MTKHEYLIELNQESDSIKTKIFRHNLYKHRSYLQDNTQNFQYSYVHLPIYDQLLDKYSLERIAGQNDTFSIAVNIMQWISEHTFYYGFSKLPPSYSDKILDFSFDKGFNGAINCANKAILLSDCLLSLKIPSIPIWLTNQVFDKGSEFQFHETCHVIVHVWINEINKWVMFDPSFNAYLIDQHGNPLNSFEIKELFMDNKDISLAKYNLNGSNEDFRERYIYDFLVPSMLVFSIWNGNAYENRNLGPGQNFLVPKDNIFLEHLNGILHTNLATEEQKAFVKDWIEKFKSIPMESILKKPILKTL